MHSKGKVDIKRGWVQTKAQRSLQAKQAKPLLPLQGKGEDGVITNIYELMNDSIRKSPENFQTRGKLSKA